MFADVILTSGEKVTINFASKDYTPEPETFVRVGNNLIVSVAESDNNVRQGIIKLWHGSRSYSLLGTIRFSKPNFNINWEIDADITDRRTGLNLIEFTTKVPG